MSEQQQKAEIEKIIKELIATYGNYFLWRDKILYYKIDGKIDYEEDVDYGCGIEDDVCRVKSLILEMERLVRINPEFVLYVNNSRKIDLDVYITSCIYSGFISFDLMEPLIPASFEPEATPDAEIFEHVFDKDPLTQVLGYTTLKLGIRNPAHAYVCPQIYFVTYLNGDLGYLSMASAKRGVVAYCTTFENYKYEVVSEQLGFLNWGLFLLSRRAKEKLWNYERKISSLAEDERKKYCNICAIKDLISKEIKKVDKLMKQYGIIRVAFPLD